MKRPPPHWATNLLEWYCKPELLEDLDGDLHEIYHAWGERHGNFNADLYYVWLVLRSFRYSTIRRIRPKSTTKMTQNHFKIAWRIMRREKLHSVLNVTGLAIGVACFLLIGFYVMQELSFDSFHSRKDDIYRIWVKEDYGEGRTFFNTTSPLILKEVLGSDFTQIEEVVQYNVQNRLVGPGEDKFNESVAILSASFFEVFDFELLEGDPANVLGSLNSLVISESYARKYFGEDPAMGRSMDIGIGDTFREFVVSGIIRDIPQNSGIQFDMAISDLLNKEIYGEEALTNWFFVTPESYVLLKPGTDVKKMEVQLDNLVMSNLGEEINPGEYVLGLQPLTSIHLDPAIPQGIVPVGNRDQVFILAAICLLVVVIACINYTMLAIGQSFRRTREVGIRKVMGAFQTTLLQQYLIESILTVIFATLLGILLANLLLPLYNDLTGARVDLTFRLWHLLLYGGLILALGIASGIYPGFVLSRGRTATILQGNNSPMGHRGLRKGLVIFQFVITVFLLSCSLIMHRQMNFLQNHDPGHTYMATISVPLIADPNAGSFPEVVRTAMDKGDLLKEKLQQYPEISNIGMGSHVFGASGWTKIGFPDDKGGFQMIHLLLVDPYYLETFHIKILEGRSMDPNNPADQRQSVLLNEAAAKQFGLNNPVGARLPNKEFASHQIIGITQDFNFESLHTSVAPLIITQNPEIFLPGITDISMENDPTPKLVFSYEGNSLLKVKDLLEESWKSVYPEADLSFDFVEENMQTFYAGEQRMQRLVLLATILSIVIACLGLFGLTILTVNSRMKEISIRKVIGASDRTIFGMLVKTVSLQLLIALLIGIPSAYLLMSHWLNAFAYQIRIGAGVFVLSGLASLAMVMMVVSYHSWRAARTNPANTLRSE